MGNNQKIRYWFTELVAALFVLLFLYTAIAKLRNIWQFEESMRNSPLIRDYARALSWTVPITEIVTTVALIIPRARYTGLVTSVVLMALFTGYIGYMLATMSHLPCRCGGIIEAMSWQQHFWFNITFLILGIAGLVLARKNIIMIDRRRRTPVKNSRQQLQ